MTLHTSNREEILLGPSPACSPVVVTAVAVHARTHLDKASACIGGRSGIDWFHSRYTRRLADTAIGGRPARIELPVHRLYCVNPLCPKTTFAEQIDGLTVRYQRRTPLLQRLVQIAGVMSAGRGDAWLLHLLYAGLSRTSVLLHLMRIPLPATGVTDAPPGPCWSTPKPGH